MNSTYIIGEIGQNHNGSVDIAKLLVASENFTKRARGEQKPLTYSTIITELEKVWGIINQEDTTLIDPYGYDVRINH